MRKLNNNESNQLLCAKLHGIDFVSSEILALSSQLENLPLALIQAAAFIQENTMTISEYLGLLGKSDYSLVELLSEEFETVGRDSQTPRAATTTWMVLFEQIQQRDPFSSELLSLISLFDRQAIPTGFLSQYCIQQQGQESRSGIQLTKALGVLNAFSFLVENKSHGLDMYRLVQLVTRKWLLKMGTISWFTEQALLVMSHAYSSGEFETWITCRNYLPHVYVVLRRRGTESKDEMVAKATPLYKLAWFLEDLDQWKDAEKFLVQATEIWKLGFGEKHPDTLKRMNNLALTFWNQGRWKEAEDLEVQVVGTSSKVLGDEHPDTLTSIANLALTFWNQGQWKEAEDLGVQVMETSSKGEGDEHPDTLTRMNNLAFT